jgi:myosin heavy subunit
MRRKYQRTLRQIIIVQSAVRKWMARRLYKKLRQEARSVEHVKKLNKGLENKIISLQQKIEQLVSHLLLNLLCTTLLKQHVLKLASLKAAASYAFCLTFILESYSIIYVPFLFSELYIYLL